MMPSMIARYLPDVIAREKKGCYCKRAVIITNVVWCGVVWLLHMDQVPVDYEVPPHTLAVRYQPVFGIPQGKTAL